MQSNRISPSSAKVQVGKEPSVLCGGFSRSASTASPAELDGRVSGARRLIRVPTVEREQRPSQQPRAEAQEVDVPDIRKVGTPGPSRRVEGCGGGRPRGLEGVRRLL